MLSKQTKLRDNEGREATRRAIQYSLDVCQLGYIDLYLIHGPPGGPQMRKESWEEVVQAHKDGKLKSIGISNYGVRHMEEIRTAWGEASEEVLKDDTKWEGVKPSVNQIDVHRKWPDGSWSMTTLTRRTLSKHS